MPLRKGGFRSRGSRYAAKYIRTMKQIMQKKKKKTLAQKVKIINKKLTLAKPEVKYFDSYIGNFKFAEWNSATNDSALQAFTINYPKQGTGVSERLGDKIEIKNINFRFELDVSAITQDIEYHIYLLRWNEYTPNTTVSLANMLTFFDADVVSQASGTAISTRSFRNKEQAGNWEILRKIKGKVKQMSAMNVPNSYFQNAYSQINLSYKVPHRLNYIRNGGGDATQISEGAHVLLFVGGSSSNANLGGQVINVNNLQYRINYTDV